MVVSACPLPGTWQAAAPSLPCHPSVPTGSTAQWGHPLGVLGTELGFELLVGQAVVATSLGCLPSPASSHCHSPRVPPPHRQTPALPCRAPPFCGGNCCWEGRPDGAAGGVETTTSPGAQSGMRGSGTREPHPPSVKRPRSSSGAGTHSPGTGCWAAAYLFKTRWRARSQEGSNSGQLLPPSARSDPRAWTGCDRCKPQFAHRLNGVVMFVEGGWSLVLHGQGIQLTGAEVAWIGCGYGRKVGACPLRTTSGQVLGRTGRGVAGSTSGNLELLQRE